MKKKELKNLIKEEIIKELQMDDGTKIEFAKLQIEDIISTIDRDISKLEKEIQSPESDNLVKIAYENVIPKLESHRQSLNLLFREL